MLCVCRDHSWALREERLILRFWTVLLFVLLFPVGLRKVSPKVLNVIMICYILLVLAITFGIRDYEEETHIVLNPIFTYQYLIRSAVTGFKSGGFSEMWIHIRWYKEVMISNGLNILLLMPLGYLLPRVLNVNWWKVLLVGLGFSLFIEIMQPITHLGWFDTSDLLHNTLGSLIGFLYYKLLEKHTCSQ